MLCLTVDIQPSIPTIDHIVRNQILTDQKNVTDSPHPNSCICLSGGPVKLHFEPIYSFSRHNSNKFKK